MSDTKKLNIEFAQKLQQAWGDFSAAVEAEMTTLHEEAICFSMNSLEGRIRLVAGKKLGMTFLEPLGLTQVTTVEANQIQYNLCETSQDFTEFDEATAQKFKGE